MANSHTLGTIDQLVIAVIAGGRINELRHELLTQGYQFTQIESSDNMVHEPTACLLIGLNSTRLESLLEIIHGCCKAYRRFIPAQIAIQPYQGQSGEQMPMIEALMGGALICVLNVENFLQF
jgi:uncharacterized protein YaaQ